jgi:prepilin-type N-terminal cleavage/methylation domain-containing protein
MERLTNKRGFSLVELMVVVAIIGVLASIGTTSYKRMIGKARESEAKMSLGALYTAEKGFHAQYGFYSTIFQWIGFGPTGSVRYNVGFQQGRDITTYPIPIPPGMDHAYQSYGHCSYSFPPSGDTPTPLSPGAPGNTCRFINQTLGLYVFTALGGPGSPPFSADDVAFQAMAYGDNEAIWGTVAMSSPTSISNIATHAVAGSEAQAMSNIRRGSLWGIDDNKVLKNFR